MSWGFVLVHDRPTTYIMLQFCFYFAFHFLHLLLTLCSKIYSYLCLTVEELKKKIIGTNEAIGQHKHIQQNGMAAHNIYI